MEERIYELRMEIVRLIKHPAVLQSLVPHVIKQAHAKEIKRLYDISSERANHRLLDLLIKSDEPGKWTSFQQALEHFNYPYLVTLLKTNTASYNQHRRILEIFAPFLERSLNPLDVVDKLYQLDVIDEPDKELVLAEQTNKGAIAATMILLDRIQTHLSPEKWYRGFLEALSQNSYEYLVREIDPDFYEKRQLNGYDLNHETDTSYMKETEVPVEAVDTDNSVISENINRFRDVITEMLDIRSIINVLIPTVISADSRDELIQTYEQDQTKATYQLLEKVISTGKGEEFMDCLESSDYPYLARLIRKQGSNGHNVYCQKVIQIFSSNIQQQIHTPEVLSRLVEQNVINQRDMELIQSEYRRKGNTAATVVLLDRIQSRLSPEEWYSKFLNVLMATSHDHVVDIIEPDFRSNPDQFLIKMEQMDHTALSCASTSKPNNVFEEEMAAIYEIKQTYLHSKLKAKKQILEEQEYMTKFVNDTCKQLQMDVKEKALSFETDLENYKEAVLEAKERNRRHTENEAVENELDVLKQRFPQFSGNTELEVHFERNLTLHFLTSVGYVTDIRPANLQKEISRTDEEVHDRIPLTLDNIRLTTDDLSQTSTSDVGSAFLQITTPLLVSDDEMTSLDADLGYKAEQHEYAIESGTIEVIVTKKVPSLNHLSLKDIIAVSEQQLAGIENGICAKGNMLILIDTGSFDIVSRIPLENEYSNKLALLNGHAVAVMSPDLQPLSVISFDNTKTMLLEWDCDFNKNILTSHKNCVYMLCLGRHLHVYSLNTGSHNFYILGGPSNKSWHPKCAVLNASGTEIFISDTDSVYSFKIKTENKTQEELHCIHNDGDSLIDRQLFIGMSLFYEDIVLLDKNNNSILKINGQSGLFRGEIVSSSFSDCDFVAFDREENLIHLVSYRYNEYKKVKLVSGITDTSMHEDYDPYYEVT